MYFILYFLLGKVKSRVGDALTMDVCITKNSFKNIVVSVSV